MAPPMWLVSLGCGVTDSWNRREVDAWHVEHNHLLVGNRLVLSDEYVLHGQVLALLYQVLDEQA